MSIDDFGKNLKYLGGNEWIAELKCVDWSAHFSSISGNAAESKEGLSRKDFCCPYVQLTIR